MKVEEIENEWSIDCVIDELKLGYESASIPKLHHKYYKILIRELMLYEKLSGESDELQKNKFMYYSGRLSTKEREDLGWEVFEHQILKTDVDRFISSDKDVIGMRIRVAVQNEKINYLKSILKQIQDRNYIIKNMIDFRKFENGIS